MYFYNSLTRKKELFTPRSPNTVKMYCCGVTPYSDTHVGHARTFFSYDLLYRTLKDQGYIIDWARNITDVDDKIINKANAEGISCAEVVERYVSAQNELLAQCGLFKPAHEPKVTEHIPQIISLIETLMEKQFAYVSASGVYYRVAHFSQYGKLSGNKIADLRSGVRIDVDENKEDPLDFALWKFAKPGEIFWESPWGIGRPGWHIECSAMIHSLFGDSIDIHMGGRDLIFPHHEAEIAQSEAASGQPLSTFWLYAGMVNLEGEKMSKSKNHFLSMSDAVKKYPVEVLRMLFLSVSYSQSLDFTHDLAEENIKKIVKIYRFFSLLEELNQRVESDSSPYQHFLFFNKMENLIEKMRKELNDDLNSSSALALFFEFMKEVNQHLSLLEKSGSSLSHSDKEVLQKHLPLLKKWFQNTLGLLIQPAEDFFRSLKKFQGFSEVSTEEIELKIKERLTARQNKDWAQADRIRNDLLSQGITLLDTPTGTRWTISI